MKSNILLFALILGVLLTFQSCKEEAKSSKSNSTTSDSKEVLKRKKVRVPPFDAEAAYNYVDKQVRFGPRVPNSEAHRKTKEWLVKTFKSFDLTVIEQDFDAKAQSGKVLKSTNIIAQYNPGYKERIFISAHWDCRHVADQDVKDQDLPIDGANDGGSGVGVILELAKKLKENPIELGVDFILFDAEDQGKDDAFSWCLGSQYWAKNLHVKDYKPNFGINLDMVGAKNATFLKEGLSMKYVGKEMNKIWSLASKMGYGKNFVNTRDGELIDDHRFVMLYSGIPCMDIIDRKTNTPSGFVPEWHTHNDNMSAISKESLKAIGQTLLATIYNINNHTF